MKPAPFAYLRPDSLEAALEALDEHGADAAILAGGQSLMPELATRVRAPKVLVDVNRIGAAHAMISADSESLTIGANARHRDVVGDATVARTVPMLAHAGTLIGNVAIRNRGTFGGSIAHADPSAEWPLCLLALDGRITVASTSATRSIAAETFFTGRNATSRGADEMVVSATVPIPDFAFFDEIALRPTAPAIASLSLSRARDGTIRTALGAVADRPILIAATALAALAPDPDWRAVRAVAEAEIGDLFPVSDRTYRLHLVMTLLGRAARALRKVSDPDQS
ncbi:FAD binding domain-containing protein [Amorphus orientalis]|uniref:CO/xanthine dehydrogenase FAD-binding subunit n=1 Tax=Amorphus orientalis TaxID=649198 RepID=A0AAE4AVN9_9HYPH|nr:FAD binding domain-containing protein [Amorphus orientalis]MDQ0316859.1 CO/xanthine dehydrogenase FAD-binding subunit [Amorphus orientalis]